MPAIKVEIRRGAYYDSLVLMELQVALTALPGIINAGVMMGLEPNKEILKQNGLLNKEAETAQSDDLIISVEGEDETAVQSALRQVDNLLSARRTTLLQDYHPKSLQVAAQILPQAKWVLVSVPGRYAAGLTREALSLNKHVFVYSDNVPLEEEIALKKEAANQGLLIMGPDCGTAHVNGIGLGFANRVSRGSIGLIGASGTGLQQVTARIHQQGSGITHALGTGGRDLNREVNGVTTRQGLDLLRRDPETKVIILISKPPAPEVTAELLQIARAVEKPVVINFIGYPSPAHSELEEHICFTSSLDEAAERAVDLANSQFTTPSSEKSPASLFSPEQRYLRGLFSGGTLAYETLLILQNYLPVVHSNIPLNEKYRLADSTVSQGHTILDLGEDEFTVGRPHPMLDNTIRLQRLEQEAADPTVALILLDVVLGDGAHPDPASELAPAISAARAQAKKAGRELEVVAVVIGTDDDPQDMAAQIKQLKSAGASVETSNRAAACYVGRRLQALSKPIELPPVDLNVLQQPVQAINIGLVSFAASISAQDAQVIHVDWRPPAGGNEKLLSILERMKKK